MNKQYRVIFNQQRGEFMVVSEKTNTQNKSSSKNSRISSVVVATAIGTSLMATQANADNWLVTEKGSLNTTNNTTLSFFNFEDPYCAGTNNSGVCNNQFRPGQAPKYAGSAGFFDSQGATEAREIALGKHPNTPDWYDGDTSNANDLINMKKGIDFIEKLNKLRERDGLNPYLVSHKLIAIAQIYNDQGWGTKLNEENYNAGVVSHLGGYTTSAPLYNEDKYLSEKVEYHYENGGNDHFKFNDNDFSVTGVSYGISTREGKEDWPRWSALLAKSTDDAISFDEYKKAFEAYASTNGQTFYNENQTVTVDVKKLQGDREHSALNTIYGGYANGNKNANGNTVNVKNFASNNSYMNDLYADYTEKGNANNNTVNVNLNSNTNIKIDELYAGKSGNKCSAQRNFNTYTPDWCKDHLGGSANGNVINIIGSSDIDSDISGNVSFTAVAGSSMLGDANNNVINISGNAKISYSKFVAGYSAGGNANNNIVNISDNAEVKTVIGATASKFKKDDVGTFYGSASNNIVNINDNAKIGSVYGASGCYECTLSNNVVNINGGTIKSVNAGIGGNVTDSTVNYFDGAVEYLILAAPEIYPDQDIGYAGIKPKPLAVNIQNVQLNFGSIDKPIKMNTLSAGGISKFTAYNFYLPNNVKNGDTALKLTGVYDDSYTDDYGHATPDNGKRTNSYLANADINVYLAGDANLKQDDIIHLISTDTNLYWNGQGNIYQGITLKNDLGSITLDSQRKNLDLTILSNNNSTSTGESTDNGSDSIDNSSSGSTGEITDNGSDSNDNSSSDSIGESTDNGSDSSDNSSSGSTGESTDNDSDSSVNSSNDSTNEDTDNGSNNSTKNTTQTTQPTVNPKTKSLLETRLVAPAIINQSSEELSGSLDEIYSVTGINKNADDGSVFAITGVNDQRINTGSHIDVKGGNLKAGYAHNFKNNAGTTLVGMFAEYGYGKYDSYLDDNTHGEGNTHHLGAGVFINHTFENDFYAQASVKAGKVKSDYKSNDFGRHAHGETVSFDTNSTYISTHIGVGKIMRLSNSDSIDAYGKYFYTRTSSDDTKLSSGETYQFDAVNSQRIRIGARYDHSFRNPCKTSNFLTKAVKKNFQAT